MTRYWVSWYSGYYVDESCTTPPFQVWITGSRQRPNDGLTPELLAKFTHEVLTAAWVNSFMSYTRKIWVKQTGQGSQNSDPLGYQVLAQATLDILEEERREYGEYDEEDDPTPEETAEAMAYFMPAGEPK